MKTTTLLGLSGMALLLAAGAASAQSSVTVSGGVDLGIARVDGDNRIQTAGRSTRSNLTFSGREDLGNGTYAAFLLNHRMNPNNGSNNPGGNDANANQFWRNSFVEIGGGFGAIRLGRFLSPHQELNGGFDAFGTDTVGSVHTGGVSGNVRVNNAVEYRSPVVGGLQLLALVAESQGQGDTPAAGQSLDKPVGLSLKYAAGPLVLAVALDKRADGRQTNAAYGSYKLGFGTVMAQYEDGEKVVGSSVKSQRVSVSTKIPVGSMDFKAGFADFSDENRSKLGLGVDYNLSKRTQLYADLGKLSGTGATALQKKLQYDVGIYHKF